MNAADRRHVVVLEAPAQRVDEQLLDHRSDELVAPPGQQRLAARRDRRTSCRRAARPTRRSAYSPSPVVRQRPMASKFSSAKPSGSIWAWQLAHTGLLRCCSIRSRTDAGFPPSPFSGSAGTSGGGAGGGAPRMFSSSHFPRTTGEVRVAYDVTVRMLPCPSRPRRGLVGKRDPAEVAAVHVRDAVVAGQPLVDEGVVGGQEVRPRCDRRAAGWRRTARFRAGTPAAGCRRTSETR